MRKRIQRPSPALVVSLIALFVALGGTGYAATQLAKNSVGAKHLKKNAVTTKKIKKNAVTGAKVKDGSLTKSDFAAGTLLQGAQGEQGVQGPIGPAGPVATASNAVNVNTAVVGSTEITSAQITIAQEARILATTSVTALGNGGNDDEVFCFLNDGAGGGGDDYGERQSSGLPAVEGGADDNEQTLTIAAARVRPAGTYTVKVFCGANNGNVTVDSANIIVWAGTP